MKVLVLAGTSEARQIAAGLAEMLGIEPLVSLAGATRTPAKMPCPTRVGGFGGKEGFRKFMREQRFDAVIDATHPFADRMSATAAEICAEMAVPHVQVLRPEWQPDSADHWVMVDHEEQVADLVPDGATVFLATGRQTLASFSNLQHCELICRQIDPPSEPFPFANGRFLVGRPPFSVEDEKNLFRDLGVDWLVVKNSGANASRSKLDAARALGLPVAMINRPAQPDCDQYGSVREVLEWVAERAQK